VARGGEGGRGRKLSGGGEILAGVGGGGKLGV
jgi:hypothetical protein